ncbi:hypothetical protein Z043_112821 [Scleropages formosus]|uniref:Uncharacterized protein n=1 Tax=Scleropages formosus TaxID=113540 RepID=A0A0P7UJQ7_SCLFO|nr:hypothetical protein Z043_112821 [Scleropages formosus]
MPALHFLTWPHGGTAASRVARSTPYVRCEQKPLFLFCPGRATAAVDCGRETWALLPCAVAVVTGGRSRSQGGRESEADSYGVRRNNMSDLLLKEMDEVPLSEPKKAAREKDVVEPEEEEGNGLSFLLVDEQENLQVRESFASGVCVFSLYRRRKSTWMD